MAGGCPCRFCISVVRHATGAGPLLAECPQRAAPTLEARSLASISPLDSPPSYTVTYKLNKKLSQAAWPAQYSALKLLKAAAVSCGDSSRECLVNVDQSPQGMKILSTMLTTCMNAKDQVAALSGSSRRWCYQGSPQSHIPHAFLKQELGT